MKQAIGTLLAAIMVATSFVPAIATAQERATGSDEWPRVATGRHGRR